MDITKKQLEFIKFIEYETDIKFIGTTKEEASKYISENKNKIPSTSYINTWSIENGY
jgi:RNase P/RNase MRP subunit p30